MGQSRGRRARSRARRARRFESLEARCLLASWSGLPATSAHDPALHQHHALEHHVESPLPMLWDAHESTGVRRVHNEYGLDGSGQTVAVIDSGVAWDHVALGGGFGSGYRVVGGWDFAEGDANPFDDGPAGYHGTHVAGIIGSSHSVHTGVAPGTDLVALRVFDDQGAGVFSWVENALQWVYDSRLDFNSPITTVNLSLGTTWNSDSVPSWTTLEDEFAALRAAGVFIAVSAGNSFADYGTPGLSYPAASPYVVPIASVDNQGNLSGFSQRNERVLAAPGEQVTSTVPDHIFGADGNPNDFGTASGTSMAAPYAAGASVLVRQAMEFLGTASVDQQQIYDHLRSTADLVYDAATSQWYHSIDVGAALDALMPEDDYASLADGAHNLRRLRDTRQVSGLLAGTQDEDAFRFVANATGTVEVTAGVTDGSLQMTMSGGSAWTQRDANTWTLDVVAGESYTFALQSVEGIGYYDAQFELEPAMVDWGRISDQLFYNQAVGGTFRMEAGLSGWLTLVSQAGADQMTVRNADGVVLGYAEGDGPLRLDIEVAAGDAVFLEIAGSSDSADIRAVNLVEWTDSTVVVHGTDGDDVFHVRTETGAAGWTINGIDYSWADTLPTQLAFRAGAGFDQLHVQGTSGDEHLSAGPLFFTWMSLPHVVTASDWEEAVVESGGGNDDVTFFDSSGTDRFFATESAAWIEWTGQSARVEGFAVVNAVSFRGGDDEAWLYDTSRDDRFFGRGTSAWMEGDGYTHHAEGFAQVTAVSGRGGLDVAHLYDTDGRDTFYGKGSRSWLEGPGFHNETHGFYRVHAYALLGGDDRAYLYDTADNDVLYGKGTRTWIEGGGSYNFVQGFERVDAFSVYGGEDIAYLYDTAGDETFYAKGRRGWMTGDQFETYAEGFSQLYGYSIYGGTDQAYLYDSIYDDVLYAKGNRAWIEGGPYYNYVQGFARLEAYSAYGGQDIAYLYDSPEDDRFYAKAGRGWIVGETFHNYAQGFWRMDAYSVYGGYDLAYLYDSPSDDVFYAKHHRTWIEGPGFYHYAQGFDRVEAYSLYGGTDQAYLYDSFGDDAFYGKQSRAWVEGSGYRNLAQGFARLDAYSIYGGTDQAYLFDSIGNDNVQVASNRARIVSDQYDQAVQGFAVVEVRASGGGDDRATLLEIDQNDRFLASGDLAEWDRGDRLWRLQGFDHVAASRTGEVDDWTVAAVDYVFEDLGI